MRRESGFTLLEVLVATVIAALALAVLFDGVGSGLRATHGALRREDALVRARAHLAALTGATALIPGHREGDDGDGYRWQLDVRPLASAAPSVPGASGHALSLYAVTVTMRWDGGRLALDSRAIGPAPPGGAP